MCYQFNTYSMKTYVLLCLSQLQLDTSPRATPGKIFWASESRPPMQFFCLIPRPGAKNDGRIPGGGQNFPRLEETTL